MKKYFGTEMSTPVTVHKKVRFSIKNNPQPYAKKFMTVRFLKRLCLR